MKVLALLLALGASVLLPVHPVTAEVLLLDAIAQEPPNSSEGVRRPQRWMSMAEVRRQFGEPDTILPWVGDPPITRWIYKDYTVYFENDRVINSVINR